MTNEQFKIGDLVIFESTSIAAFKNAIGVVIGTEVNTEFQAEIFSDVDWYVVQFGTMKLIVSNSMITKLNPNDGA